MTTPLTQSKIKALAELDGYLWLAKPTNQWPKLCIYLGHPPEGGLQQNLDRMGDVRLATKEEVTLAICANDYENHVANYNSYDAIIPLIAKWCNTDNERWLNFSKHLRDILHIDAECRRAHLIQWMICASPSKLCDALLNAAGIMPKE
jgi:hypothetical protein